MLSLVLIGKALRVFPLATINLKKLKIKSKKIKFYYLLSFLIFSCSDNNVIEYYKNGKIKKEFNLTKDNDSIVYEYFDSEQLKSSKTYHSHKIKSEVIYFDFDGIELNTVSEMRTYKDSLSYSFFKFYENGNLKVSGNVYKNEKHGEWYYYDETEHKN